MTKNFKYPGVYIQEKTAFPNSVVALPTAVPAFVGYTEKATRNDSSLSNIPTRITSLAEYQQFFGIGPDIKYKIKKDATKDFILEETCNTKYYLYNSLRLFFANGGSTCYIVSVGNYTSKINKDQLNEGIRALLKEREPTMLVIPDAVGLNEQDCFSLQVSMLNHCGSEMKNRITLLDVFDGHKVRTMSGSGDVIINFRRGIGDDFLQWGAAYHPWLNTTVVQVSEINFKKNISNLDGLAKLLTEDVDKLLTDKNMDKKTADLLKADIARMSGDVVDIDSLHHALMAVSPLYKTIMAEIRAMMNILPPSGGIAGVISMVDNNRGVWKSPANVSINQVISPTVNITNTDQEDLNAPLDGKVINAIRSFPGQGVLLWGARILDANSNEWKYINVRRTVIMVEESLKEAIKAFVFEPNNQKTWLVVKAVIDNFLIDLWKRGALAGTTTQQAFYVSIGLGTTMTQQDILNGVMKITVGLALIKPAEFIVIDIQQKIQQA